MIKFFLALTLSISSAFATCGSDGLNVQEVCSIASDVTVNGTSTAWIPAVSTMDSDAGNGVLLSHIDYLPSVGGSTPQFRLSYVNTLQQYYGSNFSGGMIINHMKLSGTAPPTTSFRQSQLNSGWHLITSVAYWDATSSIWRWLTVYRKYIKHDGTTIVNRWSPS